MTTLHNNQSNKTHNANYPQLIKSQISSNSQCPQCHHKYTQQLSSSKSQLSSSESQSLQDHLIIPLRKNIVNMNYRQKFNGTPNINSNQYKILQKQIQSLKKQNIQKDFTIKKLLKTLNRLQNVHLDQSKDLTNQISQKFNQHQKQINNLRNQMKNMSKNKEQHSLKKNKNTKSYSYFQNNYNNGNRQSSRGKNQNYQKYNKVSDQYYLGGLYSNTNNKRKQINLEDLQIQKEDLYQRLKHLQMNNRWMTNFIYAFIQMAQGFSQQYQQQIFASSWGLKKKAKVSWRYMKHLIRFWLKDS